MSTTLKVLNAKKEIASYEVTKGNPVVIDAQDKVNYQLINNETGLGPQNIITKRDGNNLHIMLEDGDLQSDIIINNYYGENTEDTTNLIVGEHENGNIYAYIPESGETADAVSMLAVGDVEPQALGGHELNGLLWAWSPWWLVGLGALAAGIALAANSGSSKSSSSKSSSSNGTMDTTAPEKPTVEISADGKTIRGTAEPGAKVEIDVDGDGEPDYTTTAGADGKYAIDISDKPLTNGEKIVATAQDNAGNKSEPAEGIAQDTTAPEAPTVMVSQDGKMVSGKAEPNSTVEIKDENGKVIAKATADDKGNYTAELAQPLTNGELINATSIDKAGNSSKPTTANAPDTTAPNAPVLSSFDGSTIKGAAEPNSTVQIKNAAGEVIGTGVADDKGNFSIKLDTPVDNGTEVTATATDKAGNESNESNPLAADTIAPEAPSATVSPDGAQVTGKAEPNSTVEITDEDGNVIGTAVADDEGNYVADLDKPLTNGELVKATATDAAGNKSEPTAANAPDITAPEAPELTGFDGTTVKGKAEPNSTVQIKDENDNVIGETVADENGDFSVKLANPVAAGTPVKATATDKAGNESDDSNSLAADPSQDITAPEAPSATVSPDGTQVTGKAEPNSTVEITDEDGNVIGTAVADDEGNYVADLDKPLTNGEPIKATATDEAGNKSEPTDANAPDTTAPEAPELTGFDGTTVKGKAEPNSTVQIKDENDNVIGETVADENGDFSVKLANPVAEGTEVKATATDKAGNESDDSNPLAADPSQDITAPEAPSATVSPDGTQVTGKAEPNSTVEITDEDGNVIGTAVADDEGNYVADLDKPLTNGEPVQATATDKAGNKSEPTDTNAPDTTAPEAPSATVSPDGKQVTGKAEPNSTVKIKDEAGTVIGTAVADDEGNYTVDLAQPLTNGEPVQATATDKAGNESDPTDANAPDTTDPEAPSATVSPDGTQVTGKAEPNSTVEIRDEDGNLIGTATADDEGNYTADLDKPLTNGEPVQATAIDKAGNKSEPTDANAPDITAPEAPELTGFDGTTVKGKAEPNSTVQIKDENDNVIGETVADENGDFSVKLANPVTEGTEVKATATDKAGNESDDSNSLAADPSQDITAPEAPSATVSPDGTQVTGKAEPNSTVNITDEEGNVIGTAVADDEGNYVADLDKPLTNGEPVQAIATDKAGNKSEPTDTNAPDTTAPEAPSATVSPDGKQVTGKAEPNSTVKIKDETGTVIGTAVADDEGNYTADLVQPLTNGESVQATATDKAGNESEPTDAKAPDTTAPEAPSATVSPDGTQVTGKAEPNSTVEIRDEDGNLIGTTTADDEGNYTADLDKPLTNGEPLKVTATDEAGNKSEPTDTNAPDTTAPEAPTLTEFDGTQVTGKAEPNSTVEILDENGDVIATTTADDEGNFTATLAKPVANGDEVTAKAVDKAGNRSEESEPLAADISKDTTPPEAPSATVSPDGTQVTGKAEPNSTVEITDEEGNVIGTAVADDEGNYTADLDKPLTNGEPIKATATDANNNKSVPTDAKAPDTTAPEAPSATVSPDGKQVTGKAEPNSTVEITDEEGNVIGTAVADDEGNYTADLDKPLTNGEPIKATATDANNNKSVPTDAKAPDTTAPEAPSATVSPDGKQVTGKAEPNSTVEIIDEEGNVIGTAVADDEGNYTADLDKPLTNGELIKATATDANNNKSVPTDAKAPDTTAPEAPSATVSPDGTQVTGKAEPNSTVEIRDEEGNLIGSATADGEGNYTADLEKPLTKGELVKATAIDAANNKSDPTETDAPVLEDPVAAPTLTRSDTDGSVTVKPDVTNTSLETEFRDESGNSHTVKTKLVDGKWETENPLPVGVTLDKETGEITIAQGAVEDGSTVTATGYNDNGDPAQDTTSAGDNAKTSVDELLESPLAKDMQAELTSDLYVMNGNGHSPSYDKLQELHDRHDVPYSQNDGDSGAGTVARFEMGDGNNVITTPTSLGSTATSVWTSNRIKDNVYDLGGGDDVIVVGRDMAAPNQANTGHIIVEGGDGNDLIVIGSSSTNFDVVRLPDGSYDIGTEGASNGVDSINNVKDGTTGGRMEGSEVYGGNGDDTLIILGVSRGSGAAIMRSTIEMGDGDDRVIIAPHQNTSGRIEGSTIDLGAGDDYFSSASLLQGNTFLGGTGVDTYEWKGIGSMDYSLLNSFEKVILNNNQVFVNFADLANNEVDEKYGQSLFITNASGSSSVTIEGYNATDIKANGDTPVVIDGVGYNQYTVGDQSIFVATGIEVI
ncbi:hypothetical protein BMT54_09675 [Pasteurellaceae bacterium 15-036681]|nr:hypothetical protein BMT54_09675 [Pasteurellaceae bacterium 15-036681]